MRLLVESFEGRQLSLELHPVDRGGAVGSFWAEIGVIWLELCSERLTKWQDGGNPDINRLEGYNHNPCNSHKWVPPAHCSTAPELVLVVCPDPKIQEHLMMCKCHLWKPELWKHHWVWERWFCDCDGEELPSHKKKKKILHLVCYSVASLLMFMTD